MGVSPMSSFEKIHMAETAMLLRNQMSVPTDRRYLESHEWHKLDGDVVTIGITQQAADELTDITYVALPEVGKTLTANKPFGEVESVKATSDLYSGVSGTVSEINKQLAD